MRMTYQELRDLYGPDAYKIYAFMDVEEDMLNPLRVPRKIQFKTGLEYLKPEQDLVISNRGDVTNAIYSERQENGVNVHPLIKVDFEWVRIQDPNNANQTLVYQRLAEACWAKVGEKDADVIWDESNVKPWTKTYKERRARVADKRKRSNIVDELLSQVGPFGVLSYVQTMLTTLDDKRNSYIDTYDMRFIQGVATYSGAWLETDVSAPLGLPTGTTLRHAILGALDYDNKFGGL